MEKLILGFSKLGTEGWECCAIHWLRLSLVKRVFRLNLQLVDFDFWKTFGLAPVKRSALNQKWLYQPSWTEKKYHLSWQSQVCKCWWSRWIKSCQKEPSLGEMFLVESCRTTTRSWNHGIPECVRRALKDHLVTTSCHGHLPLEDASLLIHHHCWSRWKITCNQVMCKAQ